MCYQQLDHVIKRMGERVRSYVLQIDELTSSAHSIRVRVEDPRSVHT